MNIFRKWATALAPVLLVSTVGACWWLRNAIEAAAINERVAAAVDAETIRGIVGDQTVPPAIREIFRTIMEDPSMARPLHRVAIGNACDSLLNAFAVILVLQVFTLALSVLVGCLYMHKPSIRQLMPEGKKLRLMRVSIGLSQEELGDHLGVSQPTVARMEKGDSKITDDMWKKMAELNPKLPKVVEGLWADLAD